MLVAIDDTDAESFYVRGPGGGLLTEVTSSATKYYHYNDLGSTVLVTNGSGMETNALAYSAWGEVLAGTEKPYNYVGEYGYYSHTSGQVLDELRQLGVRYYDAETGRFTQRDILATVSSTYSYCYGLVNRGIDPKGLWIELDPSDPDSNWWLSGDREPEPHGPGGAILYFCCIRNARELAEKKSQEHFKGFGLKGGYQDALRHCIGACEVMSNCGDGAYNSAVIDHETGEASWYNEGAKYEYPYSNMDLANDEIGRKIAVSGKDCFEGCLEKAQQQEGGLYTLPITYWLPPLPPVSLPW